MSRLKPKQESLEFAHLAENKQTISNVVVSARSLFLNRSLVVSLAGEKAGGEDLLDWYNDTYVGALNLDKALLTDWKGKNVLDVGAGRSLFAAEASVLGISVTTIDRAKIEFDPRALSIYKQNMSYFREVYVEKNKIGDLKELFDFLYDNMSKVMNAYETKLSETVQCDATNMEGVLTTNYYDVCVSVYFLAYLVGGDSQRRVVQEMIRVTKAGGVIIIYSGRTPVYYGVAKFRKDFEEYRRYSLGKRSGYRAYQHAEYQVHGKVVKVDEQRSGDSRLVLNITEYDPYYTYSIGLMRPHRTRGLQCAECPSVHGCQMSVINLWHKCDSCENIYCPTCATNKLEVVSFWVLPWHAKCSCGGHTNTI